MNNVWAMDPHRYLVRVLRLPLLFLVVAVLPFCTMNKPPDHTCQEKAAMQGFEGDKR